MHHPFAELIGLMVEDQRSGFSKCNLVVAEHHLNPHKVVHGAVIYALADTGIEGHQVIAGIAQAQLTTKARAEVNRLLALEPGETL